MSKNLSLYVFSGINADDYHSGGTALAIAESEEAAIQQIAEHHYQRDRGVCRSVEFSKRVLSDYTRLTVYPIDTPMAFFDE